MAQLEWQRFFPSTVEVKETKEFGRGVYAREKIPRGTEILRSEPLVHVLETSAVEDYCSCCLVAREVRDQFGQTQRALKKCKKCGFVYYCGKECQTNDWLLHKRECKVLTGVKAIHEQPLWWDKDGRGDDYTAYVRLLIRMQMRTGEGCTNREIDLLCPNNTTLEDQYTPHTGIPSRLAIHYLKTKIGMPGTEEELLRLHCKINVNSFGVKDQQVISIGSGIYTGPSFLNHACDPNCAQVFEGRTLILRAIKTIQPGEQLCIAYTHLLATYQQRQAKLWNTYRFHCQCYRCLSECKQDSPYHIMYATTGDISGEKKESMMEEGLAFADKKHKVDANQQLILECQQFLEKYKGVLHPANILNIEVNDVMRAAYNRLRSPFKILETTKRVCDAYRYCPFKDCYYDYGAQLLDLSNCQRKMWQFGHSLYTIVEAIDVLSVAMGPRHYTTGLARKVKNVVIMQLGLQVLNHIK